MSKNRVHISFITLNWKKSNHHRHPMFKWCCCCSNALPWRSSLFVAAVARIDIVWDAYISDSLKTRTREKEGKVFKEEFLLTQLYLQSGRISYI